MIFGEDEEGVPKFDAYDFKWWAVRLSVAWAFSVSIVLPFLLFNS